MREARRRAGPPSHPQRLHLIPSQTNRVTFLPNAWTDIYPEQRQPQCQAVNPSRWSTLPPPFTVPRDGTTAAEKNALKPWQKKQWCIPKVSADFVAHMEDLLELYAEPYDPARPVVCFDETSTQLLADLRPSIPAAPGRPRREDYEYLRGGTRNLFLTCEPRRGWRHVAITQQRTMRDFAQQMRWLVEEAYPDHRWSEWFWTI